ncbi:rhodanese-like domain-containing protein, partial [Brachyspira pilosicoli]|nr:rhodanese-like domain-containing protein [Brachyspira pilosicoli]
MSNTLSLIILLIVFFIIITFVKKIIFNIMSKGKYKNIKLNEAIELYKNNKNIGLID